MINKKPKQLRIKYKNKRVIKKKNSTKVNKLPKLPLDFTKPKI